MRSPNIHNLTLACVFTAMMVTPSLADTLSLPHPMMPILHAAYYSPEDDVASPDSPTVKNLAAEQPQSEPRPYNGAQTENYQGAQADGEWSGNAAPQPTQVGDVQYITGGVGDEERADLESMKGDYNLHVTSSTRTGEFKGDTHVSIIDRHGSGVVDTDAGPLFYAKLPPGTYTVRASNDGNVRERKVTVGDRKASSLHFTW